MARNSVVRPYLLLRNLLRNRPFSSSVARSCSLNETLVSSYSTESHTVLKNTFFSNSIATSQKHQVSPQHFINFRSFCSPPSGSISGPSNVVLVKSKEQLNSALKNVQDESLSAVFYSTAGKLISPKINELNETYPQITTYQIDFDEVGLRIPLSKLIITSVPTFQFFQNGKKANEYIGSNDSKLTNLYKKLANGKFVNEKLKHKDVPSQLKGLPIKKKKIAKRPSLKQVVDRLSRKAAYYEQPGKGRYW